MAIEIREMVIKTVVQQDNVQTSTNADHLDISRLRRDLLEELRKMIKEESRVANHSR